MTAPRSLSREQIAAELDAIRVRVIAAKWNDFNIPWAELENAYGDISCDALQRNFSTVGELVSYVHEALRRDALDITKSAGFRASTLTTGDGERTPAPVPSPEHAVLAREARELLHEFLAELCERDRTIGYLYLDPSCEYTPRRIAAELGLPKREVTKTLDRVGIRLRRFTALAVQPGALCAHRRRDVLHWQQTGSLPLALRLHLRRCHACRCAQREAQQAVRAAILPLIPAATLPLTAPGALARLY